MNSNLTINEDCNEKEKMVLTALNSYRTKGEKINWRSFISIICCEEKLCQFIKISSIYLNDKYYDISLRSYKVESDENFEVIITDNTKTIKAEKDMLKTRFKELTLAKIAHELKNPINTINFLTKAMKSKFKENKNSSDEDVSSSSEELRLSSKGTKVEKFLEASIGKLSSRVSKSPKVNFSNLQFISCLCDYLLLLIEDLNSFVKMDDMENPASTKLEFSNVNMVELLNFCFLIIHGLLTSLSK